MSKACKNCGSVDRTSSGRCRSCLKDYKANYYAAHREELTIKQAEYDKRHATEKSIYRAKHRKKKAEYRANHKTEAAAYRRERNNTDLQYKLSHILRSRINKAIKGKFKTGSAVQGLGCSITELREHLESLFQPGMFWENYGKNGWHIDHILPLSSFDLTDREQFLKACHYTNLQPLWAYGPNGNFAKGGRIAQTAHDGK